MLATFFIPYTFLFMGLFSTPKLEYCLLYYINIYTARLLIESQ